MLNIIWFWLIYQDYEDDFSPRPHRFCIGDVFRLRLTLHFFAGHDLDRGVQVDGDMNGAALGGMFVGLPRGMFEGLVAPWMWAVVVAGEVEALNTQNERKNGGA